MWVYGYLPHGVRPAPSTSRENSLGVLTPRRNTARMRRTLPLLLLAFALSAAPARADGGAEVPIYNAAYAAPHVDVLAGDTVTWHNESLRPHTVMAADGTWSSPRLVSMDSFGRRFEASGRSPTTASCTRRCAATSRSTVCCSRRRATRRRPGARTR